MKAPLVRCGILLALMAMVIIGFGQRLGSDGLVLSVALALGIIGLLIGYADLRLIPLLHVKEIEGQDPWGLSQNLTVLTDRARQFRPRLYLIESEAVQALAIGRTPQSGKIFLTTGLLKRFSQEEISAVLAFGLTCIRSRATLTFTIAGALADTILAIGSMIDRVLNGIIGSRQRRIQLGTWLTAPLAASLVQLAVGRQIYFKADRETARLLGNHQLLAQVLWKLNSYSQTRPFSTSPANSHFYMVNPLTLSRWGRYFHAHPLVHERIRQLVGHYPI